MNVEISVNGQPPRPGSIEIQSGGESCDWSGWVADGCSVGDVVLISFSTDGSFYAGRALVRSLALPSMPLGFVGVGALDRFPQRSPLTEAQRASVVQAVRKARKAAGMGA